LTLVEKIFSFSLTVSLFFSAVKINTGFKLAKEKVLMFLFGE